jgi:hypothetical protein
MGGGGGEGGRESTGKLDTGTLERVQCTQTALPFLIFRHISLILIKF